MPSSKPPSLHQHPRHALISTAGCPRAPGLLSYSPSIPPNVLATAIVGPYYGVHICQTVAATTATVSRETDSVYDIIKKSSPSLPLPTLSPTSLYGDEDLGCKYHCMSYLQILMCLNTLLLRRTPQPKARSQHVLIRALRPHSGYPGHPPCHTQCHWRVPSPPLAHAPPVSL